MVVVVVGVLVGVVTESTMTTTQFLLPQISTQRCPLPHCIYSTSDHTEVKLILLSIPSWWSEGGCVVQGGSIGGTRDSPLHTAGAEQEDCRVQTMTQRTRPPVDRRAHSALTLSALDAPVLA